MTLYIFSSAVWQIASAAAFNGRLERVGASPHLQHDYWHLLEVVTRRLYFDTPVSLLSLRLSFTHIGRFLKITRHTR